jgi:hypothetical protein
MHAESVPPLDKQSLAFELPLETEREHAEDVESQPSVPVEAINVHSMEGSEEQKEIEPAQLPPAKPISEIELSSNATGTIHFGNPQASIQVGKNGVAGRNITVKYSDWKQSSHRESHRESSIVGSNLNPMMSIRNS